MFNTKCLIFIAFLLQISHNYQRQGCIIHGLKVAISKSIIIYVDNNMKTSIKLLSLSAALALLSACGGSNDDETQLSKDLRTMVETKSGGLGLDAFMLPDSDDYTNIPQDANNPLSAEKVALGKLLYHETAVATESATLRDGTYSCASCHHAKSGFKAGVPQGIGDGGQGFGLDGEARVIAPGVNSDPAATDGLDVQPMTSPAILNVAYQDVMLWNGALGKASGSINTAVTDVDSFGPPDTFANSFGLSGIETQAIAGTRVHLLRFDSSSILQTNAEYQALYNAAFPNPASDCDITLGTAEGSTVTEESLCAAKAIAAYERTIIANESPFQKWLKGDAEAMSEQEMKGAYLFFDKANCVACHTGPSLSSKVGATADEMFFAIGFNDFDTSDERIHGTVGENDSKGRGGFTKVEADEYKFKVPQLYNLNDTSVFGHGASFTTVRDVVAYKNAAVKQKVTAQNIAPEFAPLGLTEAEIDDLTAFLETGLYDGNLQRYAPATLPSGNCSPVNDAVSITDLGC